jgi:hypothetical protein
MCEVECSRTPPGLAGDRRTVFSIVLVGNQIADFAPPMAGTSDSDDRAQIVHVGA